MPIGVGQAFVYDIQLSVQEAQSTVKVEAGAASVVQVNTENAEVSGTVTGKEVAELQLNGRNFSQLIALAPGVSNQTSQDEARRGHGWQRLVFGQWRARRIQQLSGGRLRDTERRH